MIFLLLMALAIWLVMIFTTNKAPEGPIRRNTCPPHAWRYHEQPGMEGVQYLQCDKCKGLPQYVGRGDE